MKYLVMGLIMLGASILQGTVLTLLPGGIASIDISLVVVIILSLLKGPQAGAVLGIASGLIEDAVFGRPLGITSMSRMLVCGAAGYLESKVFKDNAVVPALAVLGATVLDGFLSGLMSGMAGVDPGFGFGWTSFRTVESVSNLALAFVLYQPLMSFNKRFGRGHRRY